MAQYQIRELAHLTGIKAHTIRVWEQRYKLLTPERTSTNIRFYTDEDLRILLNVAVLCEHGYRISRISMMSHDQLATEVQSVTGAQTSQPRNMQQLILGLLSLDATSFELTLDEVIREHGMEHTMLETIYPFLERIGVLWQTGTINPAQEHMVSNLIRQKLVVAIDRLGPLHASPQARRFVLYLPERELHELALLFMCYMLRLRGQHVTYLGQNLPSQDLGEVTRLVAPDYLLTVLTTVPDRDDVQQYVQSLVHQNPHVGLLLYGAQVRFDWLKLPPNTERFLRMSDFVEWLQANLEYESAIAASQGRF